ncbi:RES family NAD+ phosphorylase [Fibrella arboris]|uniref:RES family NAD+ phosphorylase n=1 Tax=Fibrella arboris TaxID=3242486 RepID=UPI003522414A
MLHKRVMGEVLYSMILYRMADDRYASDLTGTGGLFTPGRWNRRGTPLVYLADHVSLAMIEVLAHSPGLPIGRMLATVEVPAKATIKPVDAADLPTDWRSWPYLDQLADLTEQWLAERTHWIMRVPSAIAPSEFIYLLNPLHPDHQTLKLVSIEPHLFDPRLK